jgi:hypothetical protein
MFGKSNPQLQKMSAEHQTKEFQGPIGVAAADKGDVVGLRSR